MISGDDNRAASIRSIDAYAFAGALRTILVAVAIVTGYSTCVLAGATPAARAASPSPGWSIDSLSEPSRFSSAETQDAVQVFSVHASGGTYELHPVEGEFGEDTAPIEWDESAEGLQQKLEALPSVGSGNITVSGGPGDENGEHPYVVTWVGKFSGNSLGSLVLEENNLSGGEQTVVQEPAKKVAPESFDRYSITATNKGARPAAGLITITDTLPPGIVATSAQVEERPARRSGSCALTVPVRCEYSADPEHPVAPGGKVVVAISVAVAKPTSSGYIENEATVAGGGASSATTTEITALNSGTSEFGIDQFSFEANDESGGLDGQAGDRPFGVTSEISFNTVFRRVPGANRKHYDVPQEVKNVQVELPLGFIGSPLAASRCPEVDMTQQTGVAESGRTACPQGSVVGEVWLVTEGEGGWLAGPYPLYNVVPERGYPAELGFNYAGFGQPVFIYATVVPSEKGYRLKLAAPDALRFVGHEIERMSLTVFGNPSPRNRSAGNRAFATNPVACSHEAITTRVEASSWGGATSTRETTAYPEVTGCGLLQGTASFAPKIELGTEQSTVDTPSGYEVTVRVPQAPEVFGQLATPEIKNARVVLPPGASLSPSIASGPKSLEVCTASQIDMLGTEVGAGHPGGNDSPYDDGLVHASAGHCPEGSQIGEVEIVTPLVEEPLRGHIYIAQPECGGQGQRKCTALSGENGELFGVYLEVAGAGIVVKLRGKISADSRTGQMATTFADDPQLPFEELRVKLYGGQRAPIANPQTCGDLLATSEFEPWSAPDSGPNAAPTAGLLVTGCGEPVPFAPSFTAGNVRPLAGDFTPFTLSLKRNDGERDIAGVSVTLPAGVLGMASKVLRCPDVQANAGLCPADSRIGTAHVAAGAGSQPLWLEGTVYFTGPYRGAPFGLSVVIPAKAGPFNLGNEVVRAGITIDPHTAQATTTTEPLRLIRDSVPFRLKAIDVAIDRPEFIFNPTNCAQESVRGSVAGVVPDGSPATIVPVSTPFAAAGCKALPFHPSFKVSTQARTSKTDGASLEVKVDTAAGTANVHEVHVSLPKQLPSRLDTLKLACIDKVFETNPSACPEASAVGTAKAITPIVATPMIGPAYLVSHGGAEFPDLEIVLQGEGVTLVLDGKTDIKKNITTSTFGTLPDAPVRSFDLKLPAGPHSVLGAPGGKLCTTRLVMPTSMRGQNGALLEQDTKLSVAGCKPAINVLSHEVRDGVATIVASVPAAGTFTAGAFGLSRAVKHLGKGGKVTVKLTLTGAERKFLAKHHGRRLQARVSLRFKPKHGRALSAGVTLLIG